MAITFRYVRSMVIEGCRDDAHKAAVDAWMQARQISVVKYKNHLIHDAELIEEWVAAAAAYKLATGDKPPYGIHSDKKTWRMPKRDPKPPPYLLDGWSPAP
jgi:hypothetical protein